MRFVSNESGGGQLVFSIIPLSLSFYAFKLLTLLGVVFDAYWMTNNYVILDLLILGFLICHIHETLCIFFKGLLIYVITLKTLWLDILTSFCR